MSCIIPDLCIKIAVQQPEAKKPGWLSAAVGPVLLGLGALANKNIRPAKSMFGPLMAQRARKYGVGLKVTRPELDTLKNNFWDYDTNKSVLGQTLDRIRNFMPNFLGLNRKDDYALLDTAVGALTRNKFRLTPDNKHKGPILDFLGRGANKGRIIGRGADANTPFNAFGSASKLDEAKVFPGIPESHGLADLRRDYIAGGHGMDPASVEAFLKQRFSGRPILKDQFGARSEGVILPDDLNTEAVLKYFASGKGKLRNYMAQRFNPIARSSRSQDVMNLLSEVTNPLTYAKGLAMPSMWKDSVKNILNFRKPYVGIGDKEFRVSIIDGKVVPYGVMQKRNQGGYYGSTLHWSDDHKSIHDFVTQQMEKLDPKYRKGLLGADVAIGKNGKPFIIEANPAIAGDIMNVSGALTDPRVLNDIHAGIAGKLPYKIKRQLALTMAPGLAVTGNDVYQRMQN